jgi:hypothetical protein
MPMSTLYGKYSQESHPTTTHREVVCDATEQLSWSVNASSMLFSEFLTCSVCCSNLDSRCANSDICFASSDIRFASSVREACS